MLQAHGGWGRRLTAAEEGRLLRKIDWHLMPLLCVVCGMNYLGQDDGVVPYASIMFLLRLPGVGVADEPGCCSGCRLAKWSAAVSPGLLRC